MRRLAMVCPIVFLILVIGSFPAIAGAPYRTDDPDMGDYRTWELYLASEFRSDRGGVSATAPHLEVNYVVLPDLQLHVLMPMVYARGAGGPAHYGYGDTEVGFKYRFYENKDWDVQIATYPLVEIPTGSASRGLGNGDPQAFLPLWFLKGLGPWTTYGGGGYWINPGAGNRDFWYVGWALQREITKKFVVGAEVFHQSSNVAGGESSTGFNIGAIINLTENHHILMSAGRDFEGPNRFSSYIAYQYTFGPGAPRETAEK